MKHWPAPKFPFDKVEYLTAAEGSGPVTRSLSASTRALLSTTVTELSKLRYWTSSGDYLSSKQVSTLTDYIDLAIKELFHPVPDMDFEVVGENCYRLLANHPAFTYYPNNPFTTDNANFNYPFPDENLQVKWDRATGFEGLLLSLVSVTDTDALTFWSLFLSSGDEYNGDDFEGIGFPYVRLNFTAAAGGVIRLKLASIPYGGIATSTINEDLFSLQITNLASDPLEVTDPEGGVSDFVAPIIIEHEFSAGPVQLDVTFTMNFSLEPPFIFYGGIIREAIICTNEPVDLEINVNTEQIEALLTSILTATECACNQLKALVKLNQKQLYAMLDDYFNTTAELENDFGTMGLNITSSLKLTGKTLLTNNSGTELSALCQACKVATTAVIEAAIQHLEQDFAQGYRDWSALIMPGTLLSFALGSYLGDQVRKTILLAALQDFDYSYYACAMYAHMLTHQEFNTAGGGLQNWQNGINAGRLWSEDNVPDGPAKDFCNDILWDYLTTNQNYLHWLHKFDALLAATTASSTASVDDCLCAEAVAPDPGSLYFDFTTSDGGWVPEHADTYYWTYVPAWAKTNPPTSFLDMSKEIEPVALSSIKVKVAHDNPYSTFRYVRIMTYDEYDTLLDTVDSPLGVGSFPTTAPELHTLSLSSAVPVAKIRIQVQLAMNYHIVVMSVEGFLD